MRDAARYCKSVQLVWPHDSPFSRLCAFRVLLHLHRLPHRSQHEDQEVRQEDEEDAEKDAREAREGRRDSRLDSEGRLSGYQREKGLLSQFKLISSSSLVTIKVL